MTGQRLLHPLTVVINDNIDFEIEEIMDFKMVRNRAWYYGL